MASDASFGLSNEVYRPLHADKPLLSQTHCTFSQPTYSGQPKQHIAARLVPRRHSANRDIPPPPYSACLSRAQTQEAIRLIVEAGFPERRINAKRLDITRWGVTVGATVVVAFCLNRWRDNVAVRRPSFPWRAVVAPIASDTSIGESDWQVFLSCAIQHGRTDVVQLLLGEGLLVDSRDEHLQTALHYAARTSNVDIARMLINAGADIDALTFRKHTPLQVAISCFQTAMVELLLEYNADPSRGRNQGALHLAAELGNLDAVQLLLDSGVPVDTTTLSNYTALHIAARAGNGPVVATLLDAGADARRQDEPRLMTPLHHATSHEHIDVVHLLLKRGAGAAEMRDAQHLSPLHIASQRGFLSIVEMLIAYGSSYDDKNRQGRTAFQMATALEHGSVACCLKDVAESNNIAATRHALWQKYNTSTALPPYEARRKSGVRRGS